MDLKIFDFEVSVYRGSNISTAPNLCVAEVFWGPLGELLVLGYRGQGGRGEEVGRALVQGT